MIDLMFYAVVMLMIGLAGYVFSEIYDEVIK